MAYAEDQQLGSVLDRFHKDLSRRLYSTWRINGDWRQLCQRLSARVQARGRALSDALDIKEASLISISASDDIHSVVVAILGIIAYTEAVRLRSQACFSFALRLRVRHGG